MIAYAKMASDTLAGASKERVVDAATDVYTMITQLTAACKVCARARAVAKRNPLRRS